MDARTGFLNRRVSVGTALSTGLSASISAVSTYSIAGHWLVGPAHWLVALIGGVAWSAVTLAADIFVFHEGEPKRGESPDVTPTE